ncbi:hypothetical protein [Streptomyces melanogenes]
MELNYALRAQAQGRPARPVSATDWRWFAGFMAVGCAFIAFV